MNQLETIPTSSWVWWLLGATLLVFGTLLVRKGHRSKEPLENSTISGMLLVCLMVIPVAAGYKCWADEMNLREAIWEDPVLSEMATTAEAIVWMEEEMGPLILDLERAGDRVESAHAEKETALADLKKINIKLDAKKREFDERFGHLLPSDSVNPSSQQ